MYVKENKISWTQLHFSILFFKVKKSLQILPGGKISYTTEKTRETVSKGFTLCWVRRKSKKKIRVQVQRLQQKTKNSSWC